MLIANKSGEAYYTKNYIRFNYYENLISLLPVNWNEGSTEKKKSF